MSLMTVNRRSAETRIESAISICSLDKAESFSNSELPMTPFKGVRSSCETLARKTGDESKYRPQ